MSPCQLAYMRPKCVYNVFFMHIYVRQTRNSKFTLNKELNQYRRSQDTEVSELVVCFVLLVCILIYKRERRKLQFSTVPALAFERK
jgi:hypothetical protein